MGKSKREERKQRSEEHKAELERLKRRKQLQSRATVVVVALGIAAAGYFAATRRSGGDPPRDGETRNGKVWSAAHGHWH